MTKLVISNRDSLREHEKISQIGEGAIVRSASSGEPWQLVMNGSYDTIDYMLLQDILYEVGLATKTRVFRKIDFQPNFMENSGISKNGSCHEKSNF